jgi:hypothetical protein
LEAEIEEKNIRDRLIKKYGTLHLLTLLSIHVATGPEKYAEMTRTPTQTNNRES